jgi:acetoin utilization deacetylase AcuC-like enzyme
MNQHSLRAARLAAGAAIECLDQVMNTETSGIYLAAVSHIIYF